ncbi:MAG: MBL fold metallo-hydrolase [Actinomycetaceae bacterium]|nr:MBL fold metallo-hydrolase [Arcanobacterium sp.]MDD7686821.1 MBL fold metallo-hydrolase [Actinomycetaceae bacterium]MDY5273596.1 MBL fold metallo-hydrolase [Arcanobacterium sp.]
MKLTIIGCSGSMSGPHSAASSYLVQARGADPQLGGLERTWNVTLDFGSGAMGQLLNYADPAMIDAMVMSHLHADHCVDIVGMQVYRRWYPEGALPQIPVFSPGDGALRTRGISGDPDDETYVSEFDFRRVSSGDTVNIGPLQIEFFQALHTVPALGIRVTGPSECPEYGSAVLTYTGDTDYCESEVQAAQGADFLLSEAAFEEGRDTVRGIHMTGVRAGELARDARARRLLLTHLQPWTDAATNVRDARSVFDGDVTAVHPGDVFYM